MVGCHVLASQILVGIYAYINPEENQKPIVLDNISPQNLKVNDYDTLKELQNICITTVKESKSNIYGYF